MFTLTALINSYNIARTNISKQAASKSEKQNSFVFTVASKFQY